MNARSAAALPAAPPRTFAEWLAALLRHFSLPPAPDPAPPVISLHFNAKPSIHVMGKDGQIDMMSEAGCLSVPYSSEILLHLLSLNRRYGAADAVSVTVDRGSGVVVVWARQRLQGLDMAAATRLIQAIRAQVDEVQRIIGGSLRRTPAPGTAVLARMPDRLQAMHKINCEMDRVSAGMWRRFR